MTEYSDAELLSKYSLIVERKEDKSLCPMCAGKGVRYKEECTSYHRGEYDYIPYKCNTCEGFGIVTIVTRKVIAHPKSQVLSPQISYVPFNPKENPEYEEQ